MVTHVFEALLNSDLLEDHRADSRALVTLRHQATQCVRVLRELGMSQEGAVSAVGKIFKLEPLAMCDSPIEKMMMASLVFADTRPFMTIPATIRPPRAKTVPKGDLVIAPQFDIGPYRLDFLVVGKDGLGNEKWINIECDGDEYHKTTMAQWESDRERNKYIRDCGIEVIRFCGSEIWKEPGACAHEALTPLVDWRRDQQQHQDTSGKLPKPI